MPDAAHSHQIVRFGVFELDLRAGELRKRGLKVRLQEKPQQVLAILLEKPGEVLTREELRQRLWGPDTFVDFDHSLGTAINKLREALGDSAESPRFIETLPRHGYRFIGHVEPVRAVRTPRTMEALRAASAEPGLSLVANSPTADSGPAATRQPPSTVQDRREGRRWLAVVAAAAVAAMVVFGTIFALNVAGLRGRLLSSARASHGVPLPKIESIAVLPLANLSGDPEQEYFADGMTEELITNLGKISALRVISRQSVMRYKGSKKPLPEIARELNVDAIVEGTVQQSGNRVRITANLLYAPTDRHLWAQTYERDLRDVLSLQDDVARSIVGQINAKVTAREQTSLSKNRPVNPEAYKLYLRSRYLANEYQREEIMSAVGYAQQAIQKDPASALGYSALALAYVEAGVRGYLPLRESFPKARAAALKALEIDETLADAHISLGQVKFVYEWDWLGAERELRRAIELNPDDAEAHHFYGNVLNSMGHIDEGIAEEKRAHELDPLSANISSDLAGHYVCAHRYDQAIDQGRKALELDPNFGEAHNQIWRSYLGKGKYKEAIAEIEKIPGSGDVEWAKRRAALAISYALAGRVKEAREMLAKASPERNPVFCAKAYASLGELDEAFALLDKAYEQHSSGLLWIQASPAWDPLRSEPRFKALVRRMNFPP